MSGNKSTNTRLEDMVYSGGASPISRQPRTNVEDVPIAELCQQVPDMLCVSKPGAEHLLSDVLATTIVRGPGRVQTSEPTM
eukprot:1157574-Amphidinium_carterae.1